jgi:hypothetical protein
MAFDAVPGGDPRGPTCPKCRRPVREGEPSTRMHFQDDPEGVRGLSGLWHGECARPYWDTFSWVLDPRLAGGNS